jgi:hypothetical protein
MLREEYRFKYKTEEVNVRFIACIVRTPMSSTLDTDSVLKQLKEIEHDI